MPLATKGSRIFLRGQSQYWCQRTDQSLSDWALALTKGKRPDHLTTVFAGADLEATEQARGYFAPYTPSSPSIGLMKDGKLVYMMERRQIEGQSADMIAAELRKAFEVHC